MLPDHPPMCEPQDALATAEMSSAVTTTPPCDDASTEVIEQEVSLTSPSQLNKHSSSAGVKHVFGELTVKAISSALLIVAKSLQTQVITEVVASSCRASAAVVESRALTNALAASLRLAADTVENESFMESVANSLAAVAKTADQDAVYSIVDHGHRIGVAAFAKSLSLTSAALENEKVMKAMGYVLQASESDQVQKITKTGACVAEAALRSNVLRKTVAGGRTVVKVASESEALQRSVQSVGGLVAKFAANETVQSAAGSAGGLVFQAVSNSKVQALSKPMQKMGTKSLDIVTSDEVQNAASKLWNLVLDAEHRLQDSLSANASTELEALAEAVSRRSQIEVTAKSLCPRLQEHVSVCDALIAEALEIKQNAILDQKRYAEREMMFVEEMDRMRARQKAITDRMFELEANAQSA